MHWKFQNGFYGKGQLKIETGFAQNMFSIPAPILIEIPQRQWTDPICDSINIEMRTLNGAAINLYESNIAAPPVSSCCVFILKYKLERDMELFVYLREARQPSAVKGASNYFPQQFSTAPSTDSVNKYSILRVDFTKSVWRYTDKKSQKGLIEKATKEAVW